MSTWWQILAWHFKTPTWHFKTPTWHFKTPTWHFKTPNMVFQNSEHGVSKLEHGVPKLEHVCHRCEHPCHRCEYECYRWEFICDLKKITPRPPPSPRIRSASFTTNVLGAPCVAAHTRQQQGAHALRGSVCHEALASKALHFTRASCQAAFDASNTTLTLLVLELQLLRCVFCSLADAMEAARHNPLEFLHLANLRTLCLLLQRHGPAWQRVPQVAGERRAALHPRELPGCLRRKQHDTDAARPRAAAAPVCILQPCGGAGGGAAQSDGVPAPGKPTHALPRAATPRAVRAACAAGCHRARGCARRRDAADLTPAGRECDAHRSGRA